MSKVNKKLLLITTLLCLLPIVFALFNYNKLPEQIPSHWNANGEINGYMEKNIFIFALPIGMALLNIFVIIFTHLDPKNKSNSRKILNYIYWIIPLVTLLVTTSSYYVALSSNKQFDITFIVFVFTSILFMIIGNYLPKIKPNYTIGIKVPWTLNDDDIWYATHRMAGPIWFISGLLVLVCGLLLKDNFAFIMMMVIISVAAIAPIIYSFMLYKNKK